MDDHAAPLPNHPTPGTPTLGTPTPGTLGSLRDPVHAVVGLIELLGALDLDPEARELTDALGEEARSLSSHLAECLRRGASADIGTAQESPPEMTVTPGPLVMVVDDSPLNQTLVEAQLQRLGYRYCGVLGGSEALSLLESVDPAAILMDCQMAPMDGTETTSRIRALEAAGQRRRIPIIALTAQTMEGDEERCRQAEMDDFVAKPATLQDLGEALARWVQHPGDIGSDAPPLFDRNVLAALEADLDDPQITATLIDTFLQQLETLRGDIVHGTDRGELDRVNRAAHTLRSTSQTVGATRLGSICRLIEDACRENRDHLPGLVTAFDSLVTATGAAYRDT